MFIMPQPTFNSIPQWNSTFPPLYDINKTYLQNAEEGPFFSGTIPDRPKLDPIDFLGFKVNSPIGIPAGPLLNSRWTSLAAKLGYDILCYKTIRSFDYPGHPLPNIIFVESENQLIPDRLPSELYMLDHSPNDLNKIGITNSFGMPSRSPSYLYNDIPKANAELQSGQLVIVSIVGTPPQQEQKRDFVDDFVATARLAKECGAKAIEANFSCPNVTTGEGCVYYNPEAVLQITSRLVTVLQDVPLIIKVGIFPTTAMMKQTFYAAAKGGARAVSGINTISMKVVDAHGKPALGSGRLTSGICGSPIRETALGFIRQAREINDKGKLGLSIIGTGGAMLPEHLEEFLNAGADVAMTATGMMWDPYLAMRYHQKTRKI